MYGLIKTPIRTPQKVAKKPILRPDISTTSPSVPFLEMQTKSYLSLYPYSQVLALFLLAKTPLGMYPSKTL